MANRREVLTGLSGICGGGPGAIDPAKLYQVDLNVDGGFPKVWAESHTGERFEVYRDRVKQKAFLITFMSIREERERQAVTANLREGVRRFGDHRVGRDLFISSITTDPEHDTLERLQEFAARHQVPSGWCFLRMDSDDAQALNQRMYRFAKIGLSARLVFYGNAQGNANAWGTFPAMIEPRDIAERIGWVLPQPRPATLRRAGPRRLWTYPEASHNREV